MRAGAWRAYAHAHPGCPSHTLRNHAPSAHLYVPHRKPTHCVQHEGGREPRPAGTESFLPASFHSQPASPALTPRVAPASRSLHAHACECTHALTCVGRQARRQAWLTGPQLHSPCCQRSSAQHNSTNTFNNTFKLILCERSAPDGLALTVHSAPPCLALMHARSCTPPFIVHCSCSCCQRHTPSRVSACLSPVVASVNRPPHGAPRHSVYTENFRNSNNNR